MPKVHTDNSKLTAQLARGNYPGGKNGAGVWQWICGLMPTHAYYAEPFVGSGAVLRRKLPALRTVALDVDPSVAAWWTKQVKWPGLEFTRGCGLQWLEAAQAQELDDDWLIYCDPPYPHATRNPGKLKVYAQEWDDAQHARLLAVVKSLPCLVMVSSYASPLYDRALHGWQRQTRWCMTRGGKRQEVLWCNFVTPAGPVVAGEVGRVTGDNWRERERIGRKQQRWQENYRRLPRHERRAILAGLLEEERGMGREA